MFLELISVCIVYIRMLCCHVYGSSVAWQALGGIVQGAVVGMAAGKRSAEAPDSPTKRKSLKLQVAS